MTAEVWDVVVVGGGPAGCSAAITLAARGVKVALVEARTYPHDKMCGEFLSPEVPALLARLGLTAAPGRMGAASIESVRLTAPDGQAWESRLPGRALGLSRYVLDGVLAERARSAGAGLYEGVAVQSVSGSAAEGFLVHTASGEIRAQAVISAHGKRAALDREFHRRFLLRPSPFVAVKAHFHGPPVPGRIELHAFPGGYCGISEIEGGKKVVCLLAHESAFARARGTQGVEGFVEWMKGQNACLRDWLREAERIHRRWVAIAQVPFASKSVMEGDVLMAGDAAGLIVPLAGDGISMALEGGILAAEEVYCLLTGKGSGGDFRRRYPAQWRKRFDSRLRVGRALQPLMLSPRGISLGLRLFQKVPALGRLAIRATRGTGQLPEPSPVAEGIFARKD